MGAADGRAQSSEIRQIGNTPRFNYNAASRRPRSDFHMAFHVTQCPGCDSTFNMNARILQSAAGKVRCGACLTVFEAAENFIAINDAEEDEDSSVFVGNDPADYFDPTQFITRSALTAPDPVDTAIPATTLANVAERGNSSVVPTVAQISSPEIKETVLADAAFAPKAAPDEISIEETDFLSAVAAELDSEPATDKQENTALSPAHEIDVATAQHNEQEYLATAPPAETDAVATSAAAPAIDAASGSDENAIDQEDGILADESQRIAPKVVATPLDALDAEATEESDEESAARLDQLFNEMQTESADFELIDVDSFDHVDPELGVGFEIDDDLEDAAIAQVDDTIVADDVAEHAIATKYPGAEEHDESGYREAAGFEAEADSDDSTHAIRARAFNAMLHDDNALEALPRESRAAIGKVLPPVELLSGVERQWGRRIALLLACLLLSAVLAAQFLWQRMPIYSRTADWRPVYEFACRIIACELPVYSEISALRSDNLVVRTHPSAANALTVSLSFRNTARFPQPFPVVILSFNSATNAIIALREFAPSEYLDAELRDLSMMPVMTPVQIEIEVIDPGADAVNYTVAFRRP